MRQRRLMKELRDISRSSSVRDGVFTCELADDADLGHWDVKASRFDPDSRLAADLAVMAATYGVGAVWLRFSFPATYPFDPPRVRVLAPFVQGGFVMNGGALCLELLTAKGWSSAYHMESVIIQSLGAMASGGARIVARANRPFTAAEADKAHEYLTKVHERHGWHTPAKDKG